MRFFVGFERKQIHWAKEKGVRASLSVYQEGILSKLLSWCQEREKERA